MSKLIILEGPDCCGKSQLAQDMTRFYRGMLFHCTASPTLFPALPDYHNNIMDNVDMNIALGNTVILDRFWPSEMVYGINMLRPMSGYEQVADHLLERTKKHDVIYVFCFSINGWNRYKVGHTDPAHSLNKEQYMWVWQHYFQQYERLKQLGVKTAMYSIEDDGSDPVNLATFLNNINGYLSC